MKPPTEIPGYWSIQIRVYIEISFKSQVKVRVPNISVRRSGRVEGVGAISNQGCQKHMTETLLIYLCPFPFYLLYMFCMWMHRLCVNHCVLISYHQICCLSHDHWQCTVDSISTMIYYSENIDATKVTT